MRSLGVDAILPWEIGILFILLGVLLIYIGNRQSKKADIDLNKLPFIKPTTKIIFGGAIIFVGVIQLFPLLR